MTFYTLVSYKEDYHYDRYSDHFKSDWSILGFDEKEDIIKAVFDLKVKVRESIGSTGNDDQWEYVILIDGRRADDWTDDQNEENPVFWEIEREARSLFDAWLEKEEERKEAARLEEEAQKKRVEAATARSVIAAEKKLLSALKEKYPE